MEKQKGRAAGPSEQGEQVWAGGYPVKHLTILINVLRMFPLSIPFPDGLGVAHHMCQALADL